MIVYVIQEIGGNENYPHQIFYITYMIIHIYYPGEPVNIHIQPLINMMQEKDWVITTKKE